MIELIRRLFYVLFFTAPLVMFSGTSELFEFNKLILIYVFTIIISALFLIDRIRTAKKPLIIGTLGFLYLIFFGSQLLSTIFSIDMHTSLFGYYGRFNGGLLSIIAYLSLFFVFVNTFDKTSVIKLLKVSLAASVVVIAWGIPGKFGHDLSCLLFTGQFTNDCWTNQFQPAVRMFSTLGQPNWLGAYIVVHFFIGLYFWLNIIISKSKKNSLWIVLYTLYLVFAFTAVLFTRSRSSLVALAVSVLLFPIIYFFIAKKNDWLQFIKKYAILLVLFILPVLVFKSGVGFIDTFITFPNSQPPPKQQIVETAPSEVTESFDIRKIVWKGAVDLGLRYPIFGSGVETFAYSYYFTRPLEHNMTSEWDFLYNKAHNEYLNYLATTGFLGLAAYLVILGYVTVLFYRSLVYKDSEIQDKVLSLCLLLGFTSILITNFFGFSTTTINLLFYILPAMVVVLHFKGYDEKLVEIDPLPTRKKVQCVVVSVLAAWLLLCVVRYYAADMQYAKAESLADVGEHGQAALHLQSALSLHNEHVYKDKLSFSLANLAFIASYQGESTAEAALKESRGSAETYKALAVFFNEDSLRQSPKNVLYKKTTSKNDYLFYQITLDPVYLKNAIKSIQEAQDLSPTDPKLPYSAALFYSLLADEVDIKLEEQQVYKDQSISAINESIALKPDYRDAYFLKGQLLNKYGRAEEARQVFEYMLKTFDQKDPEVLEELQNN